MFNKNNKNNNFNSLIAESERVLTSVTNGDVSSEYKKSKSNSDYNKVIQNLNSTINIFKNSEKNLSTRFKLVTDAIKFGLWDMKVVDGDPITPKMNSYGPMNSEICLDITMKTTFQIFSIAGHQVFILMIKIEF